MRITNTIKAFARLISNAISRRSKYELSFHREDDGVWYVDFPGWPFAPHNLAMVGGADKLCSYLSDDGNMVKVEVLASNHPLSLQGYGLLTKTYSNLTYGADYGTSGFADFSKTVWICPVTLFVLGRYPKYIYVRKR